jgi:hypothetical protein
MMAKTNLTNYCTCCLIFILSACSPDKQSKYDASEYRHVVDIRNAEKTDKMCLSELCSHVTTIILETKMAQPFYRRNTCYRE